MTEMKFFVYGSLTEGLVHFSKIKDFVLSSQSAQIKGSAYRLKVGYPVVLEEGQDMVSGLVVTLNNNALLIGLLDEFHGLNPLHPEKSLYYRKDVVANLGDSKEVVYTYFLNPAKLPKNSIHIENGDWILSLQQQPALTEKLSDRQRSYILKLGASSGRDIVPIDLPLYRELMNLELIVDKGRRLALSKLGHEVYRYLT